MTLRNAILVLSAVALAITPYAIAEEDDGFSANVTIASDYSFRGVSQTGLKPAIQGGFDYELDNGFSFGTWASNVNYGNNTSQELDLYFGYTQPLNETTSLSFTFVQLEYPGEGESSDYQEFQSSLDIGSISLGFVFSPNYLGVDDLQFTYLSAGYSATLGEDVSFDASIGMNSGEGGVFNGEDRYIDYSVGVSVPMKGLDVGLHVVGTDLDDELSEGRLVGSISKSF